MGGIFGSSPPPAPLPPSAPPPPEPVESDADLAARAARERRRRGQSETLATSWRGLEPAPGSSGSTGAPKRLLGE